MLILVFNSGSTSCRFSLINIEKNVVLAHGGVENINTSKSYYAYKNYKGVNFIENIEISNQYDALNQIYKCIFDKNIGVVESLNQIDGIGHRIVHGGEKYTEATILTDEIINNIKEISKLAPIHNNKSLDLIIECKNQFPGIINIGVFDSSFHTTIPKENYIYPIPSELYEKYKIRKYGFHGISYSYVLERYSNLVSKDKNDINSVICHLGGGSSICAIKNGRSFDTTMEYTPLTGLAMATRSGSIDPAILPVIMEKYDISAEAVIEMLNTKSGYLALANDKNMKSIVDRSLIGDKDAIFLRNFIDNNFKKHLMSMMANLETVDSIIVTGGIGAKNKEQREMLLSNLEFFGIKLDKKKNDIVFNTESIISEIDSKIPIFVIPTNEELEIAKQCKKIIEKRKNV